MKLVSNNTDADIVQRRLKEQVEWAARELAANVLRVVRGAGKSYELIGQAANLAVLSQQYFEVAGVWPHPEIAEAIALPERRWLSGLDEAELLIQLGLHAATRGALQLAASEIVGQRTQARAGESELFEGITSVERGREINRRTWVPEPFTARTKTTAKRAVGAAAKRSPKRKPRAK